MKYVEMTVDVAEGIRPMDSAIQFAKAASLTEGGPGWPRLKFEKGQVCLMDDATADKFVSRKLGTVVDTPQTVLDAAQQKALAKAAKAEKVVE